MTRGLDTLVQIFVRRGAPARLQRPLGDLPPNVLPFRPPHSGDLTHSGDRNSAAPMATAAAPLQRPLAARAATGIAPEIVVLGAGTEQERWLALALARTVSRRVEARLAFVADDTREVTDCGGGALRIGAARLWLPFAARRQGGRTWLIGGDAVRRHGEFLRAIGPVVWSCAGSRADSGELPSALLRASGVVLARPAAAPAAYTALAAQELAELGIGSTIVRVVHGVDEGAERRGSQGDDAELHIPATPLDRWRAQRGIAAGPASERAIARLAEAVLA